MRPGCEKYKSKEPCLIKPGWLALIAEIKVLKR